MLLGAQLAVDPDRQPRDCSLVNAKAAERVASDPIVRRFLERIAPVHDQLIELRLFGSRARDDWRPDSDYDILVVVEARVQSLGDSLYEAVQDVLLDTGSLISLKILTRAQFERLGAIPTPLLANVNKEGIPLGLHNAGIG